MWKHNILEKHGGRELQITRIAHGWYFQSLLALLKAITSIVDQIPIQNLPQHQPLKLLICMKMSSLLVRFCFGLKRCWSLKSIFFSLRSINFFPCLVCLINRIRHRNCVYRKKYQDIQKWMWKNLSKMKKIKLYT